MTCQELELQRIEFQQEYDAAQQLLAAAQLVLAELVDPTPEELAAANALIVAAMSLVSAATSNLMYNWYNRMLQGCIPGMSMAIQPVSKNAQALEKIHDRIRKHKSK